MIDTVGVVVPVNDEQDLLPLCLAAIRGARDHLQRSAGRRIEVRIVLVLDRCTDGSNHIAAAARDVEIVNVDARNVGMARRVGTAHLIAGTSPAAAGLWLANTDADSSVPESWLTAMITEADHGAHLVLGTALPVPKLAPPQQQLWHALHVPHEGHPHVHAANFGIRADAYQRLGGWPVLQTGEDQWLADRAARAGHLRIVRTARIPVRTSARLQGRAPRGFSDYLRGLSATTSA